MKKLSKLIAVVAAMALLMGMSTSAFAAVSPADPVSEGGVLVEGELQPGAEIVDKGSTMTQAEAVDIVKEKVGFNVDPAKIKVLDVMDLELQGATLQDGDEVTFTMAAPAGANNGDTVYVLHEYAPGHWEVLTYTVVDGKITVTLTGLSPVIIAMIEQAAADNNAANNTGKSPKTGF